jgi:phosphate transport system substrate-binding protein
MFSKFIATACAALALGSLAGQTAQAGDISGAGATFPAPVYAKWAETYRAQTKIGLNYQAIGSGGGIKQIQAKTVAFGATDKPLKAAELNAAGLYQFPMVMGGVTPIVNLPGMQPGKVRLSGALLADIYLGAVKRWSDPRIAALNPGVKFPNLPITVVHRSDGSGTSFQFTSYLALKSPVWASKVGANDAVQWPAGIGGKGNDGVSAFVKQTIGSIGYVEYAYAKQNKAAFVLIQNKAGQFPQPTAGSFSAAAAAADWSKAPGNYLLLLDQAGPNAWPITAATFILVQKKQTNAAAGRDVLTFFDWAYKNGDPAAVGLDYVPMPVAVKTLVRKQWAVITGPDNKPVYVSR